jgi:ribonuclease HI
LVPDDVGWKRNGWMTSADKPVVNKADLVRLDDLLNSSQVPILSKVTNIGLQLHKGMEFDL